MHNEQRLHQQLCFPLYAASRLVTRLYQPLLDKHRLTYPQYVVLMILWENDGLSCGEIGQKAILNSNTLTPILKRMEANGLLTRRRADDDERRVLIYLSEAGKALKSALHCLPSQLVESVDYDLEKASQLKSLLDELVPMLAEKVAD